MEPFFFIYIWVFLYNPYNPLQCYLFNSRPLESPLHTQGHLLVSPTVLCSKAKFSILTDCKQRSQVSKGEGCGYSTVRIITNHVVQIHISESDKEFVTANETIEKAIMFTVFDLGRDILNI